MNAFYGHCPECPVINRDQAQADIGAGSSLLEAVFLALVEQIRLGAAQVDNLRAAVALRTEKLPVKIRKK